MNAHASEPCVVCRQRARTTSTRCDECFGAIVADALVDSSTPYAEDVAAQIFVAAHPDGAPLEVVGEAMGLSRERIRQIEEQALSTLIKRLRLAGVTAEDVREMMLIRGRLSQ